MTKKKVEQLYLEVPTDTCKIPGSERAIRLYCVAAGAAWTLQVRTSVRLANGRTGKVLAANATLSKEDMTVLRDKLTALLDEADDLSRSS